MTRDEFHNHLVMAFAKGVEKAMEPMPRNVPLTGPDAGAAVGALLAGAARKYAQSVCELPGIAAQLKG